jgi:hypothetical protein
MLLAIEAEETTGYVLCSSFDISQNDKDFWEVGLDLPGMFMPTST